jgi:hypothetical protein
MASSTSARTWSRFAVTPSKSAANTPVTSVRRSVTTPPGWTSSWRRTTTFLGFRLAQWREVGGADMTTASYHAHKFNRV